MYAIYLQSHYSLIKISEFLGLFRCLRTDLRQRLVTGFSAMFNGGVEGASY